MKILVLDNYDSFTYNLVHMIRECGYSPEVHRNDQISIEDAGKFDKMLLSPGPGLPGEAGIMKSLIKEYASTRSILGVCLGHQGIAEVFGAELYNLSTVLHGVASRCTVKGGDKLFQHLPESFDVAHYHSWAVRQDTVGDDLEVTAVNEDGVVMAIAHKRLDIRGVQFHPESVMMTCGKQIIGNWLKL